MVRIRCSTRAEVIETQEFKGRESPIDGCERDHVTALQKQPVGHITQIQPGCQHAIQFDAALIHVDATCFFTTIIPHNSHMVQFCGYQTPNLALAVMTFMTLQ